LSSDVVALVFAVPSVVFSFSSSPPAPPAIYTLSLHDALPISSSSRKAWKIPIALDPPPTQATTASGSLPTRSRVCARASSPKMRSEEHTSELQSRFELVCRLLLEKKQKEGAGQSHNSSQHHAC